MGFSTTDWVALFIFGVSALVGTVGKRMLRIIGLVVMPFAFAGLILSLSLSHHGNTQGQGPIANNAPSINTNDTNDQSGGINVLNIIGPEKLLFAQYLRAKGFDVSFTRSSETVPPLDRKITIRDDTTTSPIIVIIAPSAL